MTNILRHLFKIKLPKCPIPPPGKNKCNIKFSLIFLLSIWTRCIPRLLFHFFTKSFELQEKGNFVTGPRICLCSTRCGRHHIHDLQMTRIKTRQYVKLKSCSVTLLRVALVSHELPTQFMWNAMGSYEDEGNKDLFSDVSLLAAWNLINYVYSLWPMKLPSSGTN